MILKNYPKFKFYLKRLIEIATNYRIRYHVPPRDKKRIIFTFDDGPVPRTLEILDMLDRYNKKAIFFLVAGQVKIYPETAREILKRGHSIGLHCLSHINMKELALAEFARQVKEGLRIIENICSIKIKYFRPPFGQISFSQAIWILMRNMILFFWSCGVSPSGEFDFINPKLQKREIPGFDKHQLIVLFHDHGPLEVVESSLKFFDANKNNANSL